MSKGREATSREQKLWLVSEGKGVLSKKDGDLDKPKTTISSMVNPLVTSVLHHLETSCMMGNIGR